MAPDAPQHALDLAPLAEAAQNLRRRNHAHLAGLLAACRRSVDAAAPAWVEASTRAKGWSGIDAATAEEWTSGPLPVARFLHLLQDLHEGLAAGRLPRARPHPQHPHAWAALPARGLADPLLLAGYRATLYGEPGTTQHEPPRHGGIALVLGAGNVTATPVLDVLHQVFLQGRAVLLKPSPLHRALAPHFQAALAPLVEAGLLALRDGDAAAGQRFARAPAVDAIHLTGSQGTWAQLCSDPALAGKHLSAEVGCCTPVLVVPGPWRAGELRHVARQLAACCAMNGGATCLAPRVLVTARQWPQRQAFLQCVREALAALPAREPFHPTVRDHFVRATGLTATAAAVPPTLRADLELPRDAALLRSEPFAPVLLELPLAGDDAATFLDLAANTVRDVCYGALAAYVWAPPRLRTQHRAAIDAAIARLPHGTVAINTWAGLGFGLGTTPWGVPPDAAREHGSGWTRGTLCLAPIRRSVVEAPFRPHPQPPWWPGHRAGTATLRALTRYYLAPSLRRLLPTVAFGLRSP